ncbi:hypothetical protein HY570_01245 [Candidatus Micrarchaeota archaeon]|nr:hypothetical protein [Candidatus Micrarchaeota archaeon]
MAEVIPAILVKTREELLERINKVSDYVENVQIDVMDGKFVPNTTVGLDAFRELPDDVGYEYHWMVNRPWEWIQKAPEASLHLVHIETIANEQEFNLVENAVEEADGNLGLALNPSTDYRKVLKYADRIERFLAMTVEPGFSGQGYLPHAEKNITALRDATETMDIEVDGGINLETAPRAVKAGANIVAAASAIFSQPDTKKAIEELRRVVSAVKVHGVEE